MQEDIHGASGIALVCDMQGQIIECLYDNLDLRSPPLLESSLTQLVDRGSLNKAFSFLAKIRAERAVFGWELNVPSQEGVISLHFAGFISEKTIFIVGSKTNHGLQVLYEELMQIDNEQMNTLHTLVKAHTELAQHRAMEEANLYVEITRLNNALVAMQRKLAKKNVQLEQLNEQKNQFLGMAAHDLRNPLHVIRSLSKFLLVKTRGKLEADLIEILENIYASSEFMTRLVNDLLDVAKIESGKLTLHLRSADLVALVRRNVYLNRVIAAQKEIVIQLTLEPLPQMSLDPDKIEQVLNNLLSNAIKYSPPGSKINVYLTQEDEHALIKIQDEGQGIPTAELDKLFKPFQTTSVQSTAGEKSTGLGLVIVKRIVEGHGGKIWVESETGSGSAFLVSLPLHRDGEHH